MKKSFNPLLPLCIVFLISIFTGCGSNTLDKDKATELLIEHFPFNVQGEFASGPPKPNTPRNKSNLINSHAYLFEENLIDLETIRIQNNTELIIRVPNDSPYFVDKESRAWGAISIFRIANENVYTVITGQINFLQITGIFQEPKSHSAEIEFEAFYEFNNFNHYVKDYTKICPINNPNQDEYCLERFEDCSHGKDEDIGVSLKLKAIAKKMDTGWQLDR